MNKFFCSLLHRSAGVKKRQCPGCDRYSLSSYIHNDSRMVFDLPFGKCDREEKCGYNLRPKPSDFQPGKRPQPASYSRLDPEPEKDPVFLDPECLRRFRDYYDQNRLLMGLVNRGMVKEDLLRAFDAYGVGTYLRPAGATIFFLTNAKGLTQTGKIINYNGQTAKRRKDHGGDVSWFHCSERRDIGRLMPCLFGEHLVGQFPGKWIGVVESEKTAIIASIVCPDLLWVATGGKGLLTTERLRPLAGRDVVLFPDLKGEEAWERKAEQIDFLGSVTVSRFLRAVANPEQIEEGLDIGDYFLDTLDRSGRQSVSLVS